MLVNSLPVWNCRTPLGKRSSNGLGGTEIGNSEGEKVKDLDWTTTSDLQSVLAVGFLRKVMIVCEQRLSYGEPAPRWAPVLTIDLER